MWEAVRSWPSESSGEGHRHLVEPIDLCTGELELCRGEQGSDLVDSSKLLASATRIYGDKMDTLWGDFLPAPAERVTPLYDLSLIHI